MTFFHDIFREPKTIIGMVHLHALPGSPGYSGNLEEVYEAACADLKALEAGGTSAFIVENFGDVPYDDHIEPITLAAFVSIATRLREQTKLPMGINLQFNDVEAEWDAAYASDADFIRVENFAETRVGPNGIFPAMGPKLMRLKGRYPKKVALLCDVNVKHTFAAVEQPEDFTIESIIEGGGDALIITGLMTGVSPTVDDVIKAKVIAKTFPIIVGSGVNAGNVTSFLTEADGAIIGSSLKKDGIVENPVDEERVRALMHAVKQ